MTEKSWDRLLLDVATNVRSLHDGVSRMPFRHRRSQQYPQYLDDMGALCACIRVFQDALSPVSQQLAIHPFEKIYRDPISMPDLLTTSVSDQMKEANKISELASQKELDSSLGSQNFPPFRNMDKKDICNRINEFNDVIINISQTVSDLDFSQSNF